MAMKLHKSSCYEKEKENGCGFCILLTTCIILILLLCTSLYLLYSCNEYRGYFWESKNEMIDDDDIKLQLYLLESNYYLDEIDKEEIKLSNIAKDYKMAKRYALKREPNCVKNYMGDEGDLAEFESVESVAENSIKTFKKLLANWNDNIDYMDIDKTVPSLLNQYQEIYFNEENWKEEKIDKRWKQLKTFYTSAIDDMETCTTPLNSNKENLEKINHIRERIVKIDDELDEKLKKLNELDKELILAVNDVLSNNVKCLYSFPQKWENIQTEEILAEREIHVLKFKLKQIRYKLMIADTPEKLDFLIKWEDNFSKTKAERFKLTVDNHYDKAKKLQTDLMKHIRKCSE